VHNTLIYHIVYKYIDIYVYKFIYIYIYIRMKKINDTIEVE
jgi:hypothetical protein